MAQEPVDYYAVLRVHPSATADVIEAAYRREALRETGRRDPLVAEAYQVLSKPEMRASYDQWHTAWMANNPDQVRLEARRRALRDAERQAADTAEHVKTNVVRTASAARTTTRLKATALREARSEQKLRAQEKSRLRRLLILHPIVAALVVFSLVAVTTVAIYLQRQWANERAQEQRLREQQVAAEQEEEARAAAEAEAAAEEAAREAAREAEREAAEAAAEAAEAAAAAAKQECLDGLAAGREDLTDCDLSGQDFTGINFTGKNLTGVDFSRSNLTGAIFDDTKTIGALWVGTTCPDGSTAPESSCLNSFLEPGDAQRPLALGQSIRLGDWTVTVTEFQANATSNARAVADYNSDPGDGFVYAIVDLKVTYEGAEQNQIPAGELTVEVNDTEKYDANTFCSLLGGSGGFETLNTGQSDNYEVCMYLPKAQTSSGLIGVYDGYSFDDDAPVRHWAIP